MFSSVKEPEKSGCSQVSIHLLQKVHSPKLKSTFGKPSSSLTIILLSQLLMQSWHCVQPEVKTASLITQGKRSSCLVLTRPRKKRLLEGSAKRSTVLAFSVNKGLSAWWTKKYLADPHGKAKTGNDNYR